MPELDHAALVRQVKDLQWKDAVALQQWIKYTGMEGGGEQDPQSHPPEFLQAFLDTRHTLEISPLHMPQPNITELWKEAQKVSPTWRHAWSLYRQGMGLKYDDPSKHHPDFLKGALEFMAQSAGSIMLMCGKKDAIIYPPMYSMAQTAHKGAGKGYGKGQFLWNYWETAAKKPRTEGWESTNTDISNFVELSLAQLAEMDHAGLIQYVKDLQRADPTAKSQWVQYASTEGGGARDPSKHPETFLKTFLEVRHTLKVVPLAEISVPEFFREAERTSEAFRKVWFEYREGMSTAGQDNDDPANMSPDFLRGALEFFGQAACAIMAMDTPGTDAALMPGKAISAAQKQEVLDTKAVTVTQS